jgi:hypothetical protein
MGIIRYPLVALIVSQAEAKEKDLKNNKKNKKNNINKNKNKKKNNKNKRNSNLASPERSDAPRRGVAPL